MTTRDWIRDSWTRAALVAFSLLTLIAGCERVPPVPAGRDVEILSRLGIVEWDVSSFRPGAVQIKGVNGAQGFAAFPVLPETRLFTQYSMRDDSVIVYIVDSGGTGSTLIQTGDVVPIAEKPQSDVLYRAGGPYGDPVITLNKITDLNGMHGRWHDSSQPTAGCPETGEM